MKSALFADFLLVNECFSSSENGHARAHSPASLECGSPPFFIYRAWSEIGGGEDL